MKCSKMFSHPTRSRVVDIQLCVCFDDVCCKMKRAHFLTFSGLACNDEKGGLEGITFVGEKKGVCGRGAGERKREEAGRSKPNRM